MSWCRADDGFDAHRKILALKTDERRWTWFRVLIYTTRYGSDVIPPEIAETVPKATARFLADCAALHLIDIGTDGVMRVHDWHEYNGPSIERREREAERKRKQRGNEWDIAGTSPGHSRDIAGTTAGQERDESVTRAQPRAGGPSHPIPYSETEALSPQNDQERATAKSERDELATLIDKLGGTGADHDRAWHDPDRAARLASYVLSRDDVGRPLPYWRKMLTNGDDVPATNGKQPLPLIDQCANYTRLMTTAGLTWEEITPQLEEYERQRGQQLSDHDLDQLRALASNPQPALPSET